MLAHFCGRFTGLTAGYVHLLTGARQSGRHPTDLLASPLLTGWNDQRCCAFSETTIKRGVTPWLGHARSSGKSASAWRSTATSPARSSRTQLRLHECLTEQPDLRDWCSVRRLVVGSRSGTAGAASARLYVRATQGRGLLPRRASPSPATDRNGSLSARRRTCANKSSRHHIFGPEWQDGIRRLPVWS
jgi:hypothetical protein